MAFKIVLLPPNVHEDWPEKIKNAIPECDVKLFHNPEDAAADLEDADAVHGTIPPHLFIKAKRLKWIAAPMAGLGGKWFHKSLVNSNVTVTNIRGVFNDHLSAHIMSMLLLFARHLDKYIHQQSASNWNPLGAATYLPDSTALIVGVGNIGTETARLCDAFGMKVIGIDPRVTEPPPNVTELYTPDMLDHVLPKADFVIVTTPETPETTGMMNLKRFRLMKPSAYFINVGRGACVVLNDLIEALQSKYISGAGLDVFETEPLPKSHQLWTTPGIIITPHVASLDAPNVSDRRTDILIENCKRFATGEPLLNIVDKANWF